MSIHKEKLGIAYSTARSILLKKLLFEQAESLEKNVCCRCGEKIETVDSFSIDHLVPWRNSANALEVYLDTSNVMFSHLSCNSSEGANKPRRKISNKTGLKGVRHDPKRKSPKKYCGSFWHNNKHTHLGWYETAVEAAKAYDAMAKEIHGDNAVINGI